MDVRNKIITILDTADIRFDVLEDRNLKVYPKDYAEEDFIHHLFSIVKPDKWYSPAVVEWLKNGTYDDNQEYYLIVEFD